MLHACSCESVGHLKAQETLVKIRTCVESFLNRTKRILHAVLSISQKAADLCKIRSLCSGKRSCQDLRQAKATEVYLRSSTTTNILGLCYLK